MKLIVLIALSLLPLFALCQNNPGQNVFIYLEGNREDYIYQAKELLTQFDDKKGQFEFWLPLNLVTPKKAATDNQMINNVLGRTNDYVFKLSVLLSESVNLKEFKSPERFALDGLLQIAGQQLEVPVHMTLMSSGNSLFYKLSFEVFMEDIPLTYRDVLTGQMVFIVKQSVWKDFFLTN
ncbi:MAG: hypothetical protein ACOCXH_05865 [Cyclobacteriaceae bacterium]